MSEVELIELFEQHLYKGDIDDFIKTNSPDKNTTLLYYVLRGDDYVSHILHEIVMMLLENGADLSASDDRGNNALMLALINDIDSMWTIEIIMHYIIANNNKMNIINMQNKAGNTALMLATDSKFLDDDNVDELAKIVKMLLENGADISATDNDGNNALMHALNRKSYQSYQIIMQLLTNIIDNNKMNIINMQNKAGNTALMFAIENFQNAIAEMLVDHDVNINVQNKAGNNALILAMFYKNKFIVKMLLDRGADITETDNDGDTAFMIAIQMKDMYIDERIIPDDATINMQNKSLNTALMLATRYNRNDIADILIHRGADIKIQNREGNTVLHLATMNNNEHVITTLNEHNPEKLKSIINIKSNKGDTALMIATTLKNRKIIKFLLSRGADVNNRKKKGGLSKKKSKKSKKTTRKRKP
jgi:ankyrin repeat protein